VQISVYDPRYHLARTKNKLKSYAPISSRYYINLLVIGTDLLIGSSCELVKRNVMISGIEGGAK
jgi:hypothetical protein